ncbi:DUF4394 domain-containing protein [Dyadobacter sp. CY345]|uniref:DUF4394 domain-containing protein n=1 Tax=Dyadobacter sp. CY345 TaxID=2909335 RepID=UPI001F4629D4|nr:DUF4394 domain-containing protein [Dyadobacter sp. CY345]MCF2446546.1 DUF4394 domain-containing protein [Dyadobacter sp. CY345]
MNFFSSLVKQAAFATALTSSMILVSCEDHRMAPTEQSLPDRLFWALSDDNKIHQINVKNTSTPLKSISVTGLVAGDALAGIDFRPATGQLYAISKQGNLYQISLIAGATEGRATRIGDAPLATALTGANIGFDFNPTVDKIRVTTSSTQNLRVNPETGMIAATDLILKGYSNPQIGAVAYTNSRAGVTAAPGVGTTLYDIDPTTDQLYIQTPPNDGGLVAVGSRFDIDIEDVGGFDISPDINASDVYPIASVKYQGKWELNHVNLTTGKLQKLGDLPAGVNIIGIAIPSLPVAYALDGVNNLRIFDPMTGASYGTKAIMGLPSGVLLAGIDIRPANGRLYALGMNSKIYSVDLGSGMAAEAATLKLTDGTPVMLNGSIFGVDFNPVADRLRVVSETGQNLRINVSPGDMNGVTVVDGTLKITGSPLTPFVTAGAYTNSYPGATATTLYDIDSNMDILYRQNPPNDGSLDMPKNLNIDVASNIGFDIGNASGMGYGIFTVGGNTNFYTVDLSNGAVQVKYTYPGSVKGLALGFGL